MSSKINNLSMYGKGIKRFSDGVEPQEELDRDRQKEEN